VRTIAQRHERYARANPRKTPTPNGRSGPRKLPKSFMARFDWLVKGAFRQILPMCDARSAGPRMIGSLPVRYAARRLHRSQYGVCESRARGLTGERRARPLSSRYRLCEPGFDHTSRGSPHPGGVVVRCRRRRPILGEFRVNRSSAPRPRPPPSLCSIGVTGAFLDVIPGPESRSRIVDLD
jgi:hypothetical protein